MPITDWLLLAFKNLDEVIKLEFDVCLIMLCFKQLTKASCHNGKSKCDFFPYPPNCSNLCNY